MDGRDYMVTAYVTASGSLDQSSQNGAVLVCGMDNIAIGYGANNFPDGVQFTKDRSERRPEKYRYFEHAERNAIYDAARYGNDILGSTMYCPWAACCDCARGIIQSGVSELVMHQERMQMTPLRWQDDVNEALSMLVEAGVELRYLTGPVDASPILVNGEWWDPAKPSPPDQDGNWFVGMDDLTYTPDEV